MKDSVGRSIYCGLMTVQKVNTQSHTSPLHSFTLVKVDIFHIHIYELYQKMHSGLLEGGYFTQMYWTQPSDYIIT